MSETKWTVLTIEGLGSNSQEQLREVSEICGVIHHEKNGDVVLIPGAHHLREFRHVINVGCSVEIYAGVKKDLPFQPSYENEFRFKAVGEK